MKPRRGSRTIQITPAGWAHLEAEVADTTGWSSIGVPIRTEDLDRLSEILGALRCLGPVKGLDRHPVTRDLIALAMSHIVTAYVRSGPVEKVTRKLDRALLGGHA